MPLHELLKQWKPAGSWPLKRTVPEKPFIGEICNVTVGVIDPATTETLVTSKDMPKSPCETGAGGGIGEEPPPPHPIRVRDMNRQTATRAMNFLERRSMLKQSS